MHREGFKDVLAERFGPDEVAKIVTFLERGFSPEGELVVVSIFLYAKEAGVPAISVLRECETEWQRNWNYQHPDIKGDLDAPGGAGVQNRASICNIHSRLGIPMPKPQGA